MSVTNLLGGLFSRRRIAKAPELSQYTVAHSAIDEYIHDELRQNASHFRDALARCPEVDVELDDGTIQRKRIDAAQGLNSDMFFGFHDRGDAPRVKTPDEIKPSHELFRQVMGSMIEHPDFKAARARTRGDEIGSALAMMAAQDALEEELKTTLKDQLQRAQEMDERQKRMQEAAEQARDPSATPEQVAQALQERRDARQQLEALAAQQEVGLNSAAQEAVANASEAGKEAAEGWANLPGNGVGQHQAMPPNEAIELARKWMANPSAARVAEMMGRLERDFRFKHSTRTVGGREVPVDVELGNDLEKLLGSELLKAATPAMRGLFYQRFAAKQLLQYEMVGEGESGKGPFVMLIDFSGSMASNERHIWAKAVGLSMLSLAQRERRAVTIIGFQGQIVGEWTFPPRAIPDLSAALEFSSLSPGGGTQPYSAMLRAEEILTSVPTFRQADIVVVTDGECGFSEADNELRVRLEAAGVRIHGISIECNVTRYLAAICTTVIPVYELSAPSEATDMLVQNVI